MKQLFTLLRSDKRVPWQFGLVLRLTLSLLIVQTADVPDEWYQSTEMAYTWLFSSVSSSVGGAPTTNQELSAPLPQAGGHDGFDAGRPTWEWDIGLRSFLYPLPFAVLFKLLVVLGLDNASTFYYAPRILTALVAFAVDEQVLRLANFLFPATTGTSASHGEEPGGRNSTDSTTSSEGSSRTNSKRTNSKNAAGVVSSGNRTRGCWSAIAVIAHKLSLTSWWFGCQLVRTQSNVVETLLVLITLQQTSWVRFLALAAVGCCLRTTFGVVVLLPAIPFLVESFKSRKFIKSILIAILMVSLTLIALACVDYLYYGRWVCTPLEFLVFNVFKGYSKFYGVHPGYWYFVPALPTLLGPQCVFLVVLLYVLVVHEKPWRVHYLQSFFFLSAPSSSGSQKNRMSQQKKHQGSIVMLSLTVLLTMTAYSPLAHKELRFILPCLPLVLILLAKGVDGFITVAPAAGTGGGGRVSASSLALSQQKKIIVTPTPRQKWVPVYLYRLTIVASICMVYTFGVDFQQGSVAMMAYLRTTISRELVTQQDGSLRIPQTVHMLTGCHSLPSYSYLHFPDGDHHKETKDNNSNKKGRRRLVEILHTDCYMEVRNETLGIRSPTEDMLFKINPLVFALWMYPEAKTTTSVASSSSKMLGTTDDGSVMMNLIQGRAERIKKSQWRTVKDGMDLLAEKEEEQHQKDSSNDDDVAALVKDLTLRQPKPKSFQGFRTLPKRFVIYSHKAKILETHFLRPNGYSLEKQMHYTWLPLDEQLDYTIDVWVRKQK